MSDVTWKREAKSAHFNVLCPWPVNGWHITPRKLTISVKYQDLNTKVNHFGSPMRQYCITISIKVDRCPWAVIIVDSFDSVMKDRVGFGRVIWCTYSAYRWEETKEVSSKHTHTTNQWSPRSCCRKSISHLFFLAVISNNNLISSRTHGYCAAMWLCTLRARGGRRRLIIFGRSGSLELEGVLPAWGMRFTISAQGQKG